MKMNEKSLIFCLERNAPMLRRCIRMQIPSKFKPFISVEDILQDLWLVARQQLGALVSVNDRAVRLWLLRIAEGAAVRVVRAQYRQRRGGQHTHARVLGVSGSTLEEVIKRVSSPIRTPSSEVAAGQSVVLVRAALDDLEEPHRTIMRRYFLEGSAAGDIAREMQMTIGAVRGIICRSRATMKRILGEATRFYSDA